MGFRGSHTWSKYVSSGSVAKITPSGASTLSITAPPATARSLGYYDPVNKDKSKQVIVNKTRVEHWLKLGAQPSDTVKQLLTRAVDSGAPAVAASTA
jgi:hypothetical protein